MDIFVDTNQSFNRIKNNNGYSFRLMVKELQGRMAARVMKC